MALKKFFDNKKRNPVDDHRPVLGPELKTESPIQPLNLESTKKDSESFGFEKNLDSNPELTNRTNPVSKINPPPAVRETGITVLGKDISFKGELRGSGSVKIDGGFQGTIILDRELTILKNGKVEADVEADYVIIEGNLVGNVFARKKVTIKEEGNLVGDIKTEKIAVDEGAILKGKIEILKNKAKPATPPQTQSPPQPQTHSQPPKTGIPELKFEKTPGPGQGKPYSQKPDLEGDKHQGPSSSK